MNRTLRTGAKLLLCGALVACTSGSTGTVPTVTGPNAAAIIVGLLSQRSLSVVGTRPSVAIGIFSSDFLSHTMLVPVQAVRDGFNALRILLGAQSNPGGDETFSLLQEFGSLLQVNVVDTLNRSSDRSETLQQYSDSLQAMNEIVTQKIDQLKEAQKGKEQERKELRSEANTITRNLNTALKNGDYGSVSQLQQDQQQTESALAEVEVALDQTKDIASRFATLLKIAQQRLNAIELNRQALIAGVRVVDVPGITDLHLLDTTQKRSGGTTRTSPNSALGAF